MADDGAMMAKTRLSQNPFAIKTTAPTRSLADSTEGKDTRPLVAPSTLKWGNECPPTPKIFLRPSPLAEQAKKLAENNTGVTCKSDGETKGGEEKMDEKNVDSSSVNSLFGGAPKELENGNSQSGFVFGQNLHERVCGALDGSNDDTPDSTIPDLSFESAASYQNSNNESSQSNGNSQEEEPLDMSPDPSTGGEASFAASSSSKSLSESAEEYQSKQIKRKFSEVAVITGEEEESNVLQMNCKLFTFDKSTSAWQERGRGFLRLNDREVDGTLQSRLVMRTQGSLRVVLNTKIWPAMTVERPSQKTVRVTAMEPEGIKVFLIMASSKDTEQLFSALDWRVTMLKPQEDQISVPEENAGGAEASTGTSSQSGVTEPDVSSDTTQSAASSSEDYASLAKRWRSSEGSDNSGVSNPANRVVSSAEDELSSDSGFPAADDS